MGDTAEGKNIAHRVKKMNMDGVRYVRDRFNVPVADADLEKLPYITFPEGSEEHKYLHERRQALHGYLPSRQPNFTEKLELPQLSDFGALLEEQSKEISTTIAFVRALNVMLKNKSIKDRWYRSSPTKRVLSVWKVCSVRLVSTARTASSTPAGP